MRYLSAIVIATAAMFCALNARADISRDVEARFNACVAKIDTDPDTAFEDAMVWRDNGGGVPARHCAALALIELGHAGEAARRMETLAADPGAGGVRERAQLLAQAGNAWILEGAPNFAAESFTLALEMITDDPLGDAMRPGLLTDRARAWLLSGSHDKAREDATAALGFGDSIDALLVRAAALRAVNSLRNALTDIERVLKLDPNNAAAYLERGLIHAQTGEIEVAKQDWVQAALLNKDGPIAREAQDHIARYTFGSGTP